MRTPFTDLIGVTSPMVGFSRSPGVVAAVTNEGGLGVLAASGYTPQELDAQMTWIENQIDGRPYGVDLLVPEKFTEAGSQDLLGQLRDQIPQRHIEFVDRLLTHYDIPRPENSSELAGADFGRIMASSIRGEGVDALLDVAFSHRISLIANALGPAPRTLVERSHSAGVLVASLVGAPKHVPKQIDQGVDILVAQGTEAGGHTGSVTTMVLTPEVIDAAEGRPVLTAGGIASGRQMAAALTLGAAGVWCGSVWLSSIEDITPDPVKDKFIDATSSDTVRSRARTGKPARQLSSAWHTAWEGADSPGALPMPLQPLLTSEAWAQIDAAAKEGHPGAIELESFYIGQVVGAFSEKRTASQIARSIMDDCDRQLETVAALLNSGA